MPEAQTKKPNLFKFTGKDGKKYSLPNADKGRKALPGRVLRDATLGGEVEQNAYIFQVFEAAEPDEAAVVAMYDLPSDEMLDVLIAWGQHGDGDGASLGE